MNKEKNKKNLKNILGKFFPSFETNFPEVEKVTFHGEEKLYLGRFNVIEKIYKWENKKEPDSIFPYFLLVYHYWGKIIGVEVLIPDSDIPWQIGNIPKWDEKKGIYVKKQKRKKKRKKIKRSEIMQPKILLIGDEYNGIYIEFIKSRKMLRFSHHWDSGYVGSEDIEIPLKEFCSKLGINLKKEGKME